MNDLVMPDKRISSHAIGAQAPQETGVIVSLLARLEHAIASYEKALTEHESKIRYVLLPSSPATAEVAPPRQQMCDLAQQLDCLCDRLDSNTVALTGMTRRCEL